jgi:thiaminase
MKAFELLMVNKNVLELMSKASIEVNDVKYIEMYKEYERMVSAGHKKTYITQYLSDEYQVNVRTVYRLINKFSHQVKL